MKTTDLPEYLIVAAAGQFDPGLAVSLRFGLNQKDEISFIAFIFKSPITLTKADLLERFDQMRNVLLLDFADPSEAFDGTIDVTILSDNEIQDAIKHYNACAKPTQFPAEYLNHLEASLQINPKSDCLIACEKVY